MEYILQVDDLCKSYEDFSLEHINFELPYGQIAGFIGINGAGKTTTLHCILGLAIKETGSIKIF